MWRRVLVLSVILVKVICYWNLNSILFHNFAKLLLLCGYISGNNFDVLSCSETYLNSNVSSDGNNLKLKGYIQGGLNKKEIQQNLCNIFPIVIFNEFYFFA